MKTRQLNHSLIVGVLAALLFAQGCNSKGSATPAKEMSVPVVAVKSERQPLAEKISLVGTLAANEAVEVRSELDGTIEEINFEEGQQVKQGHVLFRIDQRKLQATLAKAQADLKLAEANRNRYEKLVEERAISRQEYDQAIAAFESSRASVELASEQMHDATITAPFDGMTGARLVSLGQFITKGTSLTAVISDNPIKAEFRVPERYLSQVREGQKIEIVVSAYPEEKFTGDVYFIDPQVNEAMRTALVKAVVPNPDGRLRRGMFANLNLIVSVRANAITIPEKAVVQQGDRTSIFVVNAQNEAEPRFVQIGVRLPGIVEVTDGLTEGEIVVVEGYQKLRPGAKVGVRFEERAGTQS